MQNCQQTYEINKICRCCLKAVGKMRPLYGYFLDEMLRSVASVQMEPNDGLPELLCFQCVLQLSTAFRFREQCRKSNTVIREYIETNKKGSFQNSTVGANNEDHKHLEMIDPDDRDSCSFVNDIGDMDTLDQEYTLQVQESTETSDVTRTNTEFKCEICGKEFSTRKQIVRHTKTHEENKLYKCSKCDKSFAEMCNLKKHLHRHTGDLRNSTEKPHLCSICGKNFKYRSSLSKHMNFHTRKKLFNCPQCPKYYVEMSALKIHMRCHTGDSPYICHQCNRRFTQACNLKKHLRSHSGERTFKCPNCDRTFVQRDYLTRHMETHCPEKKALCSICGKRFANAKTLKVHQQIHTGSRSYACGYENCNKKFLRLDAVLIHRRTHSGEKPYSCDNCTHSFATSTQLSNHLRIHTGIKPFVCEICSKKFASKNSLSAHSKKYHSELNNQQLTNCFTDQGSVQDEASDHNVETIMEQMFEESVLLFKINENGELVPDPESTSITGISTIN